MGRRAQIALAAVVGLLLVTAAARLRARPRQLGQDRRRRPSRGRGSRWAVGRPGAASHQREASSTRSTSRSPSPSRARSTCSAPSASSCAPTSTAWSTRRSRPAVRAAFRPGSGAMRPAAPSTRDRAADRLLRRRARRIRGRGREADRPRTAGRLGGSHPDVAQSGRGQGRGDRPHRDSALAPSRRDRQSQASNRLAGYQAAEARGHDADLAQKYPVFLTIDRGDSSFGCGRT